MQLSAENLKLTGPSQSAAAVAAAASLLPYGLKGVHTPGAGGAGTLVPGGAPAGALVAAAAAHYAHPASMTAQSMTQVGIAIILHALCSTSREGENSTFYCSNDFPKGFIYQCISIPVRVCSIKLNIK